MLRAGAALLLVHSALATDSTCGVGYEPVGTKCLQLTGSGYTFDECATTECPKRGGHIIAGIASQEEFDAVFDAVTGGVTGEELEGEAGRRLRVRGPAPLQRAGNVAVDDGRRGRTRHGATASRTTGRGARTAG